MNAAQQTARAGLLAAAAVVLANALHVPLLPAAPYLLYEPSDVPLLFSAFLLGPAWTAGVIDRWWDRYRPSTSRLERELSLTQPLEGS